MPSPDPASSELALRSRRVVTPDGVRPATILVAEGRIVHLAPWDVSVAGGAVVDVGELVVMPGLVDTHVRVGASDGTEAEGFAAVTRSAAAGGVTTLLDFPLDCSPAATSVAALEARRWAALGRCWVDVGFIGGIIPGNAQELVGLHQAGVFAFAGSLAPTTTAEFPCVTERDLRVALGHLAPVGALLMVRAELPEVIDAATAAVRARGADPRAYATYLAAHPDAAELDAITLVIALASEYGTRIHVAPLSSIEPLPFVQVARAHGVRVSVATAPPYLALDAESIPDGATALACTPPIRGRSNRDALWYALEDGDIDAIVSDHAPAAPESPEGGDFLAARGGIASLPSALAAVWTEGRARGMSIETLVRLMSTAPARLVGLEGRKGRLAPGLDADLVVWDPDAAWPADATSTPNTPYAAHALTGVVRSTYVRGARVYHDGQFAEQPTGTLLDRTTLGVRDH